MLHPAIEPYVRTVRERAAGGSALSLEGRRQAYRDELSELRGELEQMDSVVDLEIPLHGRTLPARLYSPLGDEGRALVVFFHGGGFVAGDLDTHDALCRRLASDTGMRFLAVAYRLAPEHPFPAAIEDGVDVLRHVAAHRGEFSNPAARFIVMGESAGATIATVTCSILREDSIDVAAQVIIYPTLGPEMVTDSAH